MGMNLQAEYPARDMCYTTLVSKQAEVRMILIIGILLVNDRGNSYHKNIHILSQLVYA